MRALPFVVLLLAACGGGDDIVANGDGGGGDGSGTGIDAPVSNNEPPGLEGTVAAHNAERALVGVGPMTWDPALATIASNWVHQCHDVDAPIGLVDHNPGRSDTYPTYVGENVYGAGSGASGVDAVRLWVSEKSHYHHDTNSCDAGQICGHYTQVVWRDTTMVGCALYDCPGLQYGSTVVCDYGPGGNIGGQPPY